MARIIADVKELSSLFIKFCSDYDNISFVTAWAGMADNINRVLFRNREKIINSVVGLHFYQTDPEFIKKFYGVPGIRYYKHFNKEIFHPKAYLFYDENKKDWAAIVGSSNLTRGGFVNNNECNVLLTSESDNNDIFIALRELIENNWANASLLTDEEIEKYEMSVRDNKTHLDNLRKAFCVEVNDLDWNAYIYQMAKNQEDGSIESLSNNIRLNLLDTAQRLFKRYKSLSEFPDEYPSAIVGLLEDYEGISDWQFFGSMTAKGSFRSDFKKKFLRGLSNALDIIPFSGPVSENQYKEYVKVVRSTTKYKRPLTLCTRLLAMKRPDYFVCVAGRTGKNGQESTMSKLCNLLKLNRKTITLDNYWELIVQNVLNSKWYNTDIKNIPENERKIYKYRVAMLDALYY